MCGILSDHLSYLYHKVRIVYGFCLELCSLCFLNSADQHHSTASSSQQDKEGSPELSLADHSGYLSSSTESQDIKERMWKAGLHLLHLQHNPRQVYSEVLYYIHGSYYLVSVIRMAVLVIKTHIYFLF